MFKIKLLYGGDNRAGKERRRGHFEENGFCKRVNVRDEDLFAS
jgi:hypothetical protein